MVDNTTKAPAHAGEQTAQTKPELTCTGLHNGYTTDAKSFLEEAKSLHTQVKDAKAEAVEARGNAVKLGLYLAVLYRYFMQNLASTPAGAKGPSAFIASQMGEEIKGIIWGNALVVASLVYPDAHGARKMTESSYLLTRQPVLSALNKCLEKFGYDVPRAMDDANFAEMVKVTVARQEGYAKVVAGLKDKILGTDKAKETPALVAATITQSAEAVCEFLRHAADRNPDEVAKVAALVFEAMDGVDVFVPNADELFAAYKTPEYLEKAKAEKADKAKAEKKAEKAATAADQNPANVVPVETVAAPAAVAA